MATYENREETQFTEDSPVEPPIYEDVDITNHDRGCRDDGYVDVNTGIQDSPAEYCRIATPARKPYIEWLFKGLSIVLLVAVLGLVVMQYQVTVSKQADIGRIKREIMEVNKALLQIRKGQLSSKLHPCDKEDNGGCEQTCNKTGYGYECSCKEGYKLAFDNSSCNKKHPWYKIFNKKYYGPLFTGTGAWAWTHEGVPYKERDKTYWQIVPQNDGYYKILNKRWNGTLFAETKPDKYGDHRARTIPNKPDYNDRGDGLWKIVKMPGNKYKFLNKRWEGVLFCATTRDNDGDHKVWISPRSDYENEGRELWEIKQV